LQRALAAVGAGQQIALAEDGDFYLFHRAQLRVGIGRQALRAARRCAARRRQARTQAVALLGHAASCCDQQRVGALEFLVPQQQALDAFGKVFERGHVTQCRRGF
jgi:hypothetical protein